MTELAKFVLYHDDTANDVNRQPNLIGEYRLTADEQPSRLSFWSGIDAKGNLYARGYMRPKAMSEALRAGIEKPDKPIAPQGIDLRVGEAVLFEDPKANDENKRPNFHGYARETTRYIRLAGWDRGKSITGTAEPYRRDAEAPFASTEAPPGA